MRLKIDRWVQLMTNQKSEICLRSLRKKMLSEGGGNRVNERNGRVWEIKEIKYSSKIYRAGIVMIREIRFCATYE